MRVEKHPQSFSRRSFLSAAAGGTASLLAAPATQAAESAAGKTGRSTVRDRLWIFTVCPGGSVDNHLEMGNVRGGSRMTPAEGAFYLNVPNLILVREHELPRLPLSIDRWRAKSEFEQYAISVQPLDRVLWSVVGSGGKGGMAELSPVLELAKKFPNISGIYLDDFIIDRKKQPDGRIVGRPALTPTELEGARKRLKTTGRPMETWVTLYTHELLPPLADFLHLFDVLTLWTWNSDDLRTLDESLAALEAVAPKNARIALGLYIWDFQNAKPVPLDLMKHQCEMGLKWLKEKRIHEMIFLGNMVLDVGLPSAEFTRQWIKKVSDETLDR